MTIEPRIGTAGWGIPSRHAAAMPAGGSQLARYAACLDAVEINSSFYRPHRRETYARWADTVPPGFRFAVKVAKAMTHERRLADCARPGRLARRSRYRPCRGRSGAGAGGGRTGRVAGPALLSLARRAEVFLAL